MQINPGSGVDAASIGQPRTLVESRLGAPRSAGPRAVYDTTPPLILTFSDDDIVELVELAYSGDGHEEVFLGDVQLTYRPMEDVVAR